MYYVRVISKLDAASGTHLTYCICCFRMKSVLELLEKNYRIHSSVSQQVSACIPVLL